MQTITKTAFTRALSLARAQGHMWASHVEHPAVAAILAGPEPYDAAALTEAFEWAASEDNQRIGGIGFALSHTTGTGRLSWVVAPADAPAEEVFAGDVDLTISRPSLAWRVWSAQQQAAWEAELTDPRVGAELTRMLPPEPVRGELDVMVVRIPGRPEAAPFWMNQPVADDIGTRHLQVLAEAAHALGGPTALVVIYGLVEPMRSRLSFDLDPAGIVMSQTIGDAGRAITLDMWGIGHLTIVLQSEPDEALIYHHTSIWTAGATSEFLARLATTEFMERLVDRLMSWAGMGLERACQTAELAIDEVGARSRIHPRVDSSTGAWSLIVSPIYPSAQVADLEVGDRGVDDPPIFDSET